MGEPCDPGVTCVRVEEHAVADSRSCCGGRGDIPLASRPTSCSSESSVYRILSSAFSSLLGRVQRFFVSTVQPFATGLGHIKGGPEPLEKESHEFLGSKRDDRFSNPFF